MKPALLQSACADLNTNAPKKQKRFGWKRILALGLICAVVVAIGLRFFGGRNAPSADAANLTYITAAVERRNITSSITGSGSLEAANTYSVTTLVEGAILTADFEEGDQLEEGTVLYTIDSSDSDSSLEQAQLNLEQAQRSYNKQLESRNDLNVAATTSGQVYSLEVEVGDEVRSGQTIATIRDADTMRLEVPFPADESAQFQKGQAASVTLDSTFETLPGVIVKVSGVTEVLTGGLVVRTVTIDVPNPGALSPQHSASAAVGNVTSTGSGTLAYRAEETVTAKVSGEVTSIPVSEGDRVSEGQTLVVLVSEELEDSVQNAQQSLRNAELSLESRHEQLENYTITSPISGTVTDKYYKAGETAKSNQVLCVIYDLSYLTMTLSVDELDIANIQAGQTVTITADAVENRIYQGVVTKVSVVGSYSGGVTTYPVTIRIDETEGLLPGMNVDATIVLESASDVLTIPAAALQRGNTVLVTADSPSAANAITSNRPSFGGEMEEPGTDGDTSAEEPEYVTVPVTIGSGDDNYVEIVSGLQEGDTVAYIQTSSSNNMAMGMPMMGGMPAGAMPADRMPTGGGMPGGNMGGNRGGAGGRPGGE